MYDPEYLKLSTRSMVTPARDCIQLRRVQTGGGVFGFPLISEETNLPAAVSRD